MALFLLLLGGVGGGSLRYLTERSVQAPERGRRSHWAPFAINFAGCLLLGFLAGTAHHHGLDAGVMLLAGAITAFSVFGYGAVRLLRDGMPGRAGLSALLGWTVGTAAATAGMVLGLR